MKQKTQADLDACVASLTGANDHDLQVKYNLAVFLHKVNHDTTEHSAEEYAECLEVLKFPAKLAARWTYAASVLPQTELDQYKGLQGASPDINFSWAHVVELMQIKNSKSRLSHAKKWLKFEAKAQTLSAWTKYISEIVAPKVEKSEIVWTPKKALAKLATGVNGISKLLGVIGDIEITAAADDSPEVVSELTESLLHVWAELPTIAASLGIDLTNLEDADELDETVDEDAEEEAVTTEGEGDDSADVGNEDDEGEDVEAEDEDAEGDDASEDDEDGDDEEDDEDDGLPKLALRRVAAGTHPSIAEGKDPTLDDACATAATGPAASKRRGKAEG